MTWNGKVYAIWKRDVRVYVGREQKQHQLKKRHSIDFANVCSTGLWSWYSLNLRTTLNILHWAQYLISNSTRTNTGFDFTRENIKIICLIANKRGVRMKNRMKPFEFSNLSIAFVLHQCKSWLHFIIIAGKKWRELKCDIYIYVIFCWDVQTDNLFELRFGNQNNFPAFASVSRRFLSGFDQKLMHE